VTGNGDVRSVEDARAMAVATGCAAVMIGRGALGAPWIFRGEPVDRGARAVIVLRHADLIEAHLPERVALVQLKKHLAWYSAGLSGSAVVRTRLFEAASAADVRALFWALWTA
jgi:tRNA-dihydrouridine synthase